jgi:hypothetical protein
MFPIHVSQTCSPNICRSVDALQVNSAHLQPTEPSRQDGQEMTALEGGQDNIYYRDIYYLLFIIHYLLTLAEVEDISDCHVFNYSGD